MVKGTVKRDDPRWGEERVEVMIERDRSKETSQVRVRRVRSGLVVGRRTVKRDDSKVEITRSEDRANTKKRKERGEESEGMYLYLRVIAQRVNALANGIT